MNHKTEWIEIAHLYWRCDGCGIQCQSCGVKPPNDAECDGSIQRIRQITCKHIGGKLNVTQETS